MNTTTIVSFLFFTVAAVVLWLRTPREHQRTSFGLLFGNRTLGCLVAGSYLGVPIFTTLFVGCNTKKNLTVAAAKTNRLFFMAVCASAQPAIDARLHFLHMPAILFAATSGPMQVCYYQKLNSIVNRQPWKCRHMYALVLLAAMIGMFVIFSSAGINR